MTNFYFLQSTPEYALFAPAAIEAERVYPTSPAMCAIGCRKALELAVQWVYAADNTMQMPYKDNLQSLIHEPSFRFALDRNTWGKLPYIIKLGNLSVHTGRSVSTGDALASLRALFEFIQWVDYCYGSAYEERAFDEAKIPTEKVVVDTKKIKEQANLLAEKDAELEALRKKVEELSTQYTAAKAEHQRSRTFVPEDLSELETRRRYIDIDLKEMGWQLDGPDADVRREYPLTGMPAKSGTGAADYVLFGKDGLPLAVVEAKRTGKDPNAGRTQAVLYANCLERKFGRRPMIFTTNGFETYFWDDQTGPQRKVSGIFSKDDLQKLMTRRTERMDMLTVPIQDKITDRYYQKEAIRAICEKIGQGFRKHLLVMATGTGKTRTASSLTDVLSRGKHVTNILFLADRTALVKQAKDDFKKYLPDLSLCNLCLNKEDVQARIVFSTYPTILNAIDDMRSKDGRRLFTPAHFDLIIIDESHRSIFKKYRAIFEYFDAILVGLTATPKIDVDRNTYDFFEMEHGVPTYAYDYETAVYEDHVLVPYYNYEVKMQFEADEGILYDRLSDEDKERYEDDFIEDDYLPKVIPSSKLNKFIFNEITVDTVLQDLMERGIKVAGGDRIGKTIIFAQGKGHAEFILQRFNKLYPQYKGNFIQRVICDDAYAHSVIENFKKPDEPPHIVVSVDMLDTGIDVPECVNLVFFKKVRSKTKFWQMLGRGTRLCPELTCIDQIDGEYTGKRRFLIFDYCKNFEFFRQHKEGYEAHETKTLSENIFGKRIRLAALLEVPAFAEDGFQAWREALVAVCHSQVAALPQDRIAVKLRMEYVERYKELSAFSHIGEEDRRNLIQQLAPIVFSDDPDEYAKRFDNFMYGLILADMEQTPAFRYAQKQLRDVAALLESKNNIPQVKAKLSIIREIGTDAFWDANDILALETVRQELRSLIQFLMDSGSRKAPVFTRLSDPVIDQQEGVLLDPAYDFEDYRAKVNRYINEHGDTLAIYKLTHNIPLSVGDYTELERVLTAELGSREDYTREFGDTPFGLLVRKIAKMDHEAAIKAFSGFISDQSLNQQQIAFVHKVIHHIEQNGYMESIVTLRKPPFDKPISFIKLFDADRQERLIKLINAVRDNAVHTVA